jgi:hypothetical protein
VAKRSAPRKRPNTAGGRAKRAPGKRKAAPRKTVAKRTTAAKRKTAARVAATRVRRRTPPARPSRGSIAAALVRGAAAGAAAAIVRRLPWAVEENDPIVLLETDHRRFEELLERGKQTTGRALKQRTELLNALATALNVHELLEEKILYPALKPHPEAREIVLEGYQEHHVADLIVNELRELPRDDERWGAKFGVLKENIEHHIQEEEREMFRIARALLGRDELMALGGRMKTLKRDLEG